MIELPIIIYIPDSVWNKELAFSKVNVRKFFPNSAVINDSRLEFSVHLVVSEEPGK